MTFANELAVQFMQKRFWGLDDMLGNHTGVPVPRRPISNPAFYQQVAPLATKNLTDGYLTLHYVHPDTEEALLVAQSAYLVPDLIIRVQNYRLFDVMLHSYLRDPNSHLGIGFHGAKKRPMESILLNNLDPSVSNVGRHGLGTYLAETAEYTFQPEYTERFYSPVYIDRISGLFHQDEYRGSLLFVCNYGAQIHKSQLVGDGLCLVPSGYGCSYETLGKSKRIFCLRHHEQMCPAYLLLFKIPAGSDDDVSAHSQQERYQAQYAVQRGSAVWRPTPMALAMHLLSQASPSLSLGSD